MARSSVDVIAPAFERMKQQLFKPFRPGQWLRLAVTGLLAGEMGSAGGCSSNFPFNIPGRQANEFQATPVEAATLVTMVLLVALLIACALALGILFLYVNSRM